MVELTQVGEGLAIEGEAREERSLHAVSCRQRVQGLGLAESRLARGSTYGLCREVKTPIREDHAEQYGVVFDTLVQKPGELSSFALVDRLAKVHG